MSSASKTSVRGRGRTACILDAPWDSVLRLAISHLPLAIVFVAGCAHVPNQWREDGPATTAEWDSPTSKDLKAKHAPAPQRHRDWEQAALAADSGAVTHWPLYFEDPFEDKSHGREGLNKYHIGWEDYLAMPYGYARFTLNWLLFPVSAIVTPPWTLMKSDGELSRQALGYDHDATRARPEVPAPGPAEPGRNEGAEEPEEGEELEETGEAPAS
jgi:hypothetical protein